MIIIISSIISWIILTILIRFNKKVFKEYLVYDWILVGSYIPIFNSIVVVIVTLIMIYELIKLDIIFDKISKFLYGKDD